MGTSTVIILSLLNYNLNPTMAIYSGYTQDITTKDKRNELLNKCQ